jgi:pimeloyl-ACP methyl ester carboxylesterase
MPELERPDGARIHYEVRGEGPLAVLTLGFAATPQVYEGVASDLARDHRVATWHPRGCGDSSMEGPYDIGTDADDLAALIEELGAPAAVFAVAHGVNVSACAAARHPGLVTLLASPGIATAMLGHLGGTEGFASSRSVIDMLVEQLRRDPRGSIRATIGSLNPQLDDDELRARVDETLAYTGVGPTLARVESWLADEAALDELRALGDRVLVLWYAADPWQAGAVERIGELLPDARIEEVADGPLSRPDLAAALVREMTAP